jgi:hypothetical protein
MKKKRMSELRLKTMAGLAASLVLFAGLAACGGGGSDTGGSSSTRGVATAVGAVQAACSGCGAIDGSTCAGSGTGIWQSVNSSTAPVDVPLSIKGLRAQNVTRVFTNEGSASQKGAPAN